MTSHDWLASRRVALILAGSVSSLALLHCFGDGHAPNPIGDTTGGDDAGAQPFLFQSQGCAYQVVVPTTRAFTDFAPDDAKAPSDPSQAVPERVRIGLGGGTTKGKPGYADPTTSVAFTWETAIATTNAKVKLGTAPSSLTDVHAGYSFTSPPPEVGFGSSDPPEYAHEVHVCGLKAGTTYYYQVGGGASGSEIWSATQSFTTVPAAGSKITVGVFGDSRDKVGTWQTVHERMRDAAPSLLLVSGDVVDFGTEESLFSQWLDAIWKDPSDATKFLSLGQFLMVPVAGNHENDSSQFYANFANPRRRPELRRAVRVVRRRQHALRDGRRPVDRQRGAGDGRRGDRVAQGRPRGRRRRSREPPVHRRDQSSRDASRRRTTRPTAT